MTKEEWYHDDSGRLHRALRAQDTNRSDWARYSASKRERAGDRIADGVYFTLVGGACLLVGATMLAMLGIIKVPANQPVPARPVPAAVCEQ